MNTFVGEDLMYRNATLCSRMQLAVETMIQYDTVNVAFRFNRSRVERYLDRSIMRHSLRQVKRMKVKCVLMDLSQKA